MAGGGCPGQGAGRRDALDRTARDDETRMPSCQTHGSSFRGGCRGVVARVYSRRRRLYWPQKQGWAEWSSALTLCEEWAWAWEWEWQGDVARSGRRQGAGAAKTRPGKEETLVILSIKVRESPSPMGTCWVLGIGRWVLEGRVMCAFLLPVCFFFIRYSQEGADKRRQQWMIHEQPDGEGVVGTRSSAAAKIQNARNAEIPEMPEWLERKKGQKSQIQNQRRVWYQPWPGAGCASSSRHTSLSGQGKKVPENIIFSSSSASVRSGASSKCRLRIVLFPCDGCPHTPPPPCPTWKNGC